MSCHNGGCVVVESLEPRHLLSGPYLIATPSAGGAIYDAARHQVYVPTGAGSILRYDLSTQTLLAPWTAVGGDLRGGDITPDGSAIYVADANWTAGSSMVHKVTIATGALKHLPYTLDYDDTASSVAISKDGKAWIGHNGQWGDIRVIDIATDKYGTPGPNFYGAPVARGKDRSIITASDRGVSTASGGLYDANTHTWQTGPGTYPVAVSPTGSEIALGDGYIDKQFNLLRTVPGYKEPLGYDPDGTIVYLFDAENHRVTAVDRLSNVPKFSFAVATDIESAPYYGAGAATDDGHWLILPGTAGVHIYDLLPYKSPAAPPTGSIGCMVFKDANRNGVADVGEAGMANVKLFLDANSNGVLDTNEKSALTDATGNYKFTGVPQGVTYRVRQVVPSGYSIGTPSAGYYEVTLNSALTFAKGKTFADIQVGSITGKVFNDANNNKLRDVGELGLGLWRVFIDKNANGVLDSGEVNVLTDAVGNWTFSNLAPGTYNVRIVQPADTATTTATSISVTLALGQNVGGKLFGERATV